MVADVTGGMDPAAAIALVGLLGVGSQWLAWRLDIPAIVLMLAAGVIAGPVLGVLDPARDLGPIIGPAISIAVAVILFEGGLTLDFHALPEGTGKAVRRLVLLGAPIGWAGSAAALHFGAGLDWAVSAVLGGIMIVTGPTVIAPLLRQARLARRPAAVLQWEAIVNDPVGALAAVLALEVVLVRTTGVGWAEAAASITGGVVLAALVGLAFGRGLSWAFRNGHVPEYMKVPVLFAALLVAFAGCNLALHESGLLAVTVMGVVIANADLPSYTEIRRFKEHATVLLVSGVFVLLAASLDFSQLARLDLRAAVFVALAVLVVRPVTVLVSLAGTDLSWRERLLVAFTGPRGVVLVAVAGLFGERLLAVGIEDAALVTPIAFALVMVTVLVHGFGLSPLARALGLSGAEVPGLIIVGGSRFAAELGEALIREGVPVIVTDTNRAHLRPARDRGVPVYYGDILSEAAEHGLEFVHYDQLLAASDNDALNTLVATDLGPEFGRTNVWQLPRVQTRPGARHVLPPNLGGRVLAGGLTWPEVERRMREGWRVGVTPLSDAFTIEDWRARHPDAIPIGRISAAGAFRFLAEGEAPRAESGDRLVHLAPPAPAAVSNQGK